MVGKYSEKNGESANDATSFESSRRLQGGCNREKKGPSNPNPISYRSNRVADDSEVGRKIFELHKKARADVAASKLTSFKDIIGTRDGSTLGNQAYLVDLAEEIPALEIKNPEVAEYYHSLARDAVIGCFNGRWPSSTELYQW
ncbi:hypothetical protein KI387_035005, partial [Taxus chinensis]